MSAAEELSTAIRDVAEAVGPSVVAVNRSGSGLVVAENTVVTNAHNLREGDTVVSFSDGHQATGSNATSDLDGDLAVVTVDTAPAPVAPLSERPVQLGQFVIALANPRGHGLRASLGTVSSLNRSFRGPRGRLISGGLEHTAPLERGSSGGPVLDLEGRVVGINTHRLQEGFYLAVVADAGLRQRIDDLARGKAPSRRRLGAAIAPRQAARHLRAAAGLPEVDGLLVRGVEEGGAADRAGLRRGDVLVAVGGVPLGSVDDLHAALDGSDAVLEFTVVRATEEITVRVGLGPTG